MATDSVKTEHALASARAAAPVSGGGCLFGHAAPVNVGEIDGLQHQRRKTAIAGRIGHDPAREREDRARPFDRDARRTRARCPWLRAAHT